MGRKWTDSSVETGTSVAAGDLILTVSDPSGTPVSKKITVQNLMDSESVREAIRDHLGDVVIQGGANVTITHDDPSDTITVAVTSLDNAPVGATTPSTGSFTVNTVDQLVFDIAAAIESNTAGEMSWDADAETVMLALNDNIHMHVGQDSLYHALNQTGSDIAKGTAVYAVGTVGNSGKITIAPFTADGTLDSKYFMGVTAETIVNGETGFVVHFGKIRQIDTTDFEEGDILYADPSVAGGLTNVRPAAPNNIITVAIVVTKSETVGELFVRPTFVDGFADNEDVTITSATTNDILAYNGTVWVNTDSPTFAGLTVASDLTLAAGSITSASGAISFGNENLSTTGTLSSGPLTVTDGLYSASIDSSGLGTGANFYSNTTTHIGSSGASSVFFYTSGVNRYQITFDGNHNFQSGNITTTGKVLVGGASIGGIGLLQSSDAPNSGIAITNAGGTYASRIWVDGSTTKIYGALSGSGTIALGSGGFEVDGSNGNITTTGTLSAGATTVSNLTLTQSTTEIHAASGSDASTVLDFDFPDLSTAAATVRLFRLTNTSGNRNFLIYRGDGTASTILAVTPSSNTITATADLTVSGDLTTTGTLSAGATTVSGTLSSGRLTVSGPSTNDTDVDYIVAKGGDTSQPSIRIGGNNTSVSGDRYAYIDALQADDSPAIILNIQPSGGATVIGGNTSITGSLDVDSTSFGSGGIRLYRGGAGPSSIEFENTLGSIFVGINGNGDFAIRNLADITTANFFQIDGSTGATSITGTLDVSGDTIIGSTSVTPDGTLHVHTSSAGTFTPSTTYDDLIVESSGLTGIMVLAGAGSSAGIAFGTPTQPLFGANIFFSDATKAFTLGSNDANGSTVIRSGAATTALTLDSSQNATFAGTLSAGATTVTGKLNVDIDSTGQIASLNGSGLLRIDVFSEADTLGLDFRNVTNASFRRQGTEIIGFDASGASITGTLDVSSTITQTGGSGFKVSATNPQFAIGGALGSWGGNYSTLKMYGSSTTEGGSVWMTSSDDSVVGAVYLSSGLYVRTSTSHPIYFLTGGTTALTLDSSQNATFAGNVTIDGGTGVATSGVLQVRQSGDTVNDGIGITSSSATSHRIWKNASGTLNIGPSTDPDAWTQDLSGNVTMTAGDLTLSSGSLSVTDSANRIVEIVQSQSNSNAELFLADGVGDRYRIGTTTSGADFRIRDEQNARSVMVYDASANNLTTYGDLTVSNGFLSAQNGSNGNVAEFVSTITGLSYTNFINDAAVSTSNKAGFRFRLNTSTQSRDAFGIQSAFTTTTDASREATTQFLNGEGGSISTFLTVVGLDSSFSGDVRIGTTSATSHGNEKLLVSQAGDPDPMATLYGTDSAAVWWQFANSTTGNSTGDGFFVGITSDEDAYLWNKESTAMRFATAGTERFRVHSATPAISIGTTRESNWASGYSAIEFGRSAIMAANGDDALYLYSNAYYDGTEKYIATDTAERYRLVSGQHVWDVAASGTADTAITWTEAMRITNDGALRIGTTSATSHGQEKLRVYGTAAGDGGGIRANFHSADGGSSSIQFTNSTTGVSSTQGAIFGIVNGSEQAGIWHYGSYEQVFATAGTERFRVASNAYALGIGTTDVKSWDTSFGVVQFGSSAIMAPTGTSDSLYFLSNAYFDGAWKYTESNEAARHIMFNGSFEWETASAGTADGAITWSEKMRLSNAGMLLVGDTANANMTVGLTINQGANDDEILAFKSSDVSHSLTSITETDTFGYFSKVSATTGGLRIRGILEDSGSQAGLALQSWGGTADTTKSTAGVGLINLYASEHDGAGTQTNITADGNIMSVRARVGGSDVTRWILDEDGDTWQSGGATFEGTVVMMANLPTADPTNAGQLWNDSGTVKVSAG